MSASIDIAADSHVVHLPSPFPLERGGELRGGCLAYEIVGPAGAPVIVALGGISAGRRVASGPAGKGWWGAQVGPGLPLDTDRYRVLGIEWLVPAEGVDEPILEVSSLDQARALASLLDALQVQRVHALVGASYGGQVGQSFAIAYPQRVDRLVLLSAPFTPSPRAVAWRSIQRRIVAFGVQHEDPSEGLALARQLAMTTYRTEAELAARFAGGPEGAEARFPVEGWLEARGRAFAEAFTPRRFHALSLSIDLHVVDPADIAVSTFVLGIEEDALVPVGDLRRASEQIEGAVFRTISSPYGHDAFLVDTAPVAAFLARALAAEVSQ